MGQGFSKARGAVVSGGDPLPTAEAVARAKVAAVAGLAAEVANLPWPPGAAGAALVETIPLVALAVLEALCEGVPLHRLAACLALSPAEGPERLAALRAGPTWPARAFRAAMAAAEAGA